MAPGFVRDDRQRRTRRQAYGDAVGRLEYDGHGNMTGQVTRPSRARVDTGEGGVQLVRAAYTGYILTLVLVLAAPVGCGDLRVKIGVFATVDEAREAGAIAAGWIPAGVPARASDLREGHLPDGRHWGVFAFLKDDEAAVRALLGPEISSGTLSCEPPGRLEWWPRVLLTPISVDRVRSTGFHLYGGDQGRTYAINWGQGRAYYWRGAGVPAV
jgi:hypothetical protein